MPRLLTAFAALALLASDAAALGASWTRDAVVYGIAPQLFGPRGLADITDRLDELSGLGVTVLWLSPITDAPDGDFGYAVTDHFKLRAGIGSDADLHRLVGEAHRRNMKIVLDIPANDLSARHPYYQDVLRRGRMSPYYDFFARDGAGAVTHYFDWTDLENLNFDDPAVGTYLIEACAYWLREFDVDGFRLDAAWGPRERSPAFWPRWRTAMTAIKPDILLIAEASERDPYYAAAGFDAAYDWTTRPGEWAWHDAFESATPAPLLAAAFAAERAAPIFRFLDNNDTGKRFLARHGPALTRVAMTMLMTLPGVPSLYMGEEIGADYEPYSGAGPIARTADAYGMRETVRRLAELRRDQPALRSPGITLTATSAPDAVLAFFRPGPRDDALLVMLNYGRAELRVDVPDASRLGIAVEDLLTGEVLALDPAHPGIPMEGLTARVLRQRPAP